VSTKDQQQSRLIRRQRIVILIAVTCALLSASGLLASRLVKSPAQLEAETAPPKPSLITALVTDQVMTATVISRGTVGTAGGPIQVTPQASAASGASAPVVTAIYVKPGETIRPGQVLVQVSGRPLIALPGAFPAYRDLKPGDSGPDVRQLQQGLASLGYFTTAPDGQFGQATKDAVTRMYQALGYEVPTTGGPGDSGDRAALMSASSAVTNAARAVDDMKRQIAAQSAATQAASSPSGRPAPSTAAATAARTPGGEPLSVQLTYLEQALDRAISDQQDLIAHTGPELPAAEVAFVPQFPAVVSAVGGTVGAVTSGAAPLLTISSGRLVVTDQMDPTQARLVRVGMPARLDSQLLSASATGTVSAIGQLTVPSATATGQAGGGSAAGGSGAPYVPVTVTPSRPLAAGWGGQDVEVTVTSAKTSGKVLAVPLAALTTRSDEQTVVTRVDPDGATTEVAVRVGVSVDGFVQVIPIAGGLRPGDSVSVGE
jgi:peptidoglycan hydrolase-like protein with peptidoglycan-binding domain